MRYSRLCFSITLILSCILGGINLASAQSKSDIPNAEELRKGLRTLGEIFEVKPPAAAPTTKRDDSPPPSQKNIADVADRALNMVEDVTARLSNTLQSIAPEVWRIMLKQQYAKAFTAPLWSLVVILVALSFAMIGGHVWNDKSDERWWITRALPVGVGTLGGLKLAWDLKTTVLLLVNPEYYAIQDLLRTLLARSI